jgi:hypothetical protein
MGAGPLNWRLVVPLKPDPLMVITAPGWPKAGEKLLIEGNAAALRQSGANSIAASTASKPP